VRGESAEGSGGARAALALQPYGSPVIEGTAPPAVHREHLVGPRASALAKSVGPRASALVKNVGPRASALVKNVGPRASVP
jgi:hypothetical protein